MAMRRATASKGDTMINSLHALLDQLHRRPPGISSLPCLPFLLCIHDTRQYNEALFFW